MYAVNYIDSIEDLVRKRAVGFIARLKQSNNPIIFCIVNSWKMKFDINYGIHGLDYYLNNKCYFVHCLIFVYNYTYLYCINMFFYL